MVFNFMAIETDKIIAINYKEHLLVKYTDHQFYSSNRMDEVNKLWSPNGR